MTIRDLLFGRFRTERPVKTVGEEGFVHAPDAAPEDVVMGPRRGNAGPLPDRPTFSGRPVGWWAAAGASAVGDVFGNGSSDSSGGGGDFSGGDGGGGGDA